MRPRTSASRTPSGFVTPIAPSIVTGPAVGENAVVDIFSDAACAAGARASAVIATTTPLTADKLA